MPEARLLLVDDEAPFRAVIQRELVRSGYAVDSADSLGRARELLAGKAYDLCLLDVRLPDGSGLDLLAEIKEKSPGTEVVMLTAYGTVDEAIRALKLGAFDFLTKPHKLAELEAVLAKAIKQRALERGHVALQRDVDRLKPSEHFIGQSGHVKSLLALVERVATTDATVLITGESGVGKELVARAVHKRSPRTSQPFVVVDCASLHENLLQSELFGHEKGAYTGAGSLKHGLFEVADHGTIFLDEVAEITPPLQVKLLRVLETGKFRRVGGTADIEVDVRLIAATNRPLEAMLKDGSFREDLYYRLNVFALHIPPLRERREDIPLLVEHFVRTSPIARRRQATVAEEAMESLRRYAWPGNVRELGNLIERALILCDDDRIEREHLPMNVQVEGEKAGADDGRLVTLDELERRYIRRVLEECKGHRQRAAGILGISERNLYRKIREVQGEPDA